MTTSLEGSPTKAKEAPSPHEVRLAPLDTNPVFQCLGDKKEIVALQTFVPFNSSFVSGFNENKK